MLTPDARALARRLAYEEDELGIDELVDYVLAEVFTRDPNSTDAETRRRAEEIADEILEEEARIRAARVGERY